MMSDKMSEKAFLAMMKRYDFISNGGFDEVHITELGNRLIAALYAPTLDKRHFSPNDALLAQYGIAPNEPINWGDLKIIGADETPDGWRIEIDEAAPEQCPTLCAYIAKYLTAWGAKIDDVITSW